MPTDRVWCSNCGFKMTFDAERRPKFCSNCGAPLDSSFKDGINVMVEIPDSRHEVTLFIDGNEVLTTKDRVSFINVPGGMHSIKAVASLFFGSTNAVLREGSRIVVKTGFLELKVSVHDQMA